MWHDRAVFHFLTDPADRATYLRRLAEALAPAGAFIIGTFADDGPDHCSGLSVGRYNPQELGDTIIAAIPGARINTTCHEVHATPSGTAQPFTWSLGQQPDQFHEDVWAPLSRPSSRVPGTGEAP